MKTFAQRSFKINYLRSVIRRRPIHITSILVLVLLSMGACQWAFNPHVPFPLALYETHLLYPSHVVLIVNKKQNEAFLLRNRSPIGATTLSNFPSIIPLHAEEHRAPVSKLFGSGRSFLEDCINCQQHDSYVHHPIRWNSHGLEQTPNIRVPQCVADDRCKGHGTLITGSEGSGTEMIADRLPTLSLE
jgi:hypothetical protein